MKKECSNFSQLAYIRRYVLTEGKEDGIKVVEINNGVLRITLDESKALDVMQVWFEGKNVSFVSKNGFTKRETPFLKRFEGGMIYTVGLDSAGGREGFDLHGTFHNIPAKIISTVCNEEKIEVVAEICDTELFGKNLRLVRKISTSVMSGKFTVEDELKNDGTKAEEYCLLYHCNFGYPFLDGNAKVSFDGRKVVPRTAFAKERIGELHEFLPAVDNEEERCYFIENEKPEVKIVNANCGVAATLTYSKASLPKMVLWQSNASGDYALGVEPTTTFLDDGFEFSTLGAGECANMKIEMIFEKI